MEAFLLGWLFTGSIAVAVENRKLKRQLAEHKELTKHCTQTLGQRVLALEARNEVWDRMLRGVVESTN